MNQQRLVLVHQRPDRFAPNGEKSRKVIRSLAIDERKLEQLHNAANRRKISLNALIIELRDYYLSMGVRAEDVGLVHLTAPNVRKIL